jgi:TatD DNase family protein
LPDHRYIDIHSHSAGTDDALTIRNLVIGQPAASPHFPCSAGIHPWYITASPRELMKQLETILDQPATIALGECGLDLLAESPMPLQEQVFMLQAELAMKLKKPMIIHCVKAADRIIATRKKMKLTIPMIIHGFNNNSQTATELLKHGFYLSFGAAILRKNSNASKVVRDCPADKLFLETDDSGRSIIEIYKAAADLRGISKEELQRQIEKNFKHIFNE